MVTVTSLRRRANARAYPSISAASEAKPEDGGGVGVSSSRNRAGSVWSEPYTAVEDLSTKVRTSGDCWQAASSCIAPMTFCSFMRARPPAAPGPASVAMCTTVSTAVVVTILDTSGLRMSARTNSVRSSRTVGSCTSTPMISVMVGSASSCWASRPARVLEMPVMSTRRSPASPASVGVTFASSSRPRVQRASEPDHVRGAAAGRGVAGVAQPWLASGRSIASGSTTWACR